MMSDMNEIVPLLYRPRINHYSLAGHARNRRFDGSDPDETSGRLVVAPGNRCRIETTDIDGRQTISVSDGRSWWMITDHAVRRADFRNLNHSFAELIYPSWLLADFDLKLSDVVEDTGGNLVYKIRALRRDTSRSRSNLRSYPDSVNILMDGETGILLRVERIVENEPVQVVEFTDLERMDGPADSTLFELPDAHKGDLRESSLRDESPQERSIESPSANAMISDDLVNLLYRTASGPQAFSAMLREWADQEANALAVDYVVKSSRLPQWANKISQAGASQRYKEINLAARLQLTLPGRYRIDSVTSQTPIPNSIICDGTRLWNVFSDFIVSKPAKPLSAGIALLIDLAWLLSGYDLMAAGVENAEGREAFRLSAVPTDDAQLRQGPLSHISVVANKIEAVVDAKLGIAQSLTWYFDNTMILNSELLEITNHVDESQFMPPDGYKVITDPHPLVEASMSAGAVVRDAVGRIVASVFQPRSGKA